MDEKCDVSLYSLINYMWDMPLQDLIFQQWRCYAKLNMSRKLRMKSEIASNRTFTLQVRSNVGEPWTIVAFIEKIITLDFPSNTRNQGLKDGITWNWLKIQVNASICLNYKENRGWNNPWEPPLLKIGGERVISLDVSRN